MQLLRVRTDLASSKYVNKTQTLQEIRSGKGFPDTLAKPMLCRNFVKAAPLGLFRGGAQLVSMGVSLEALWGFRC